MDPNKLKPGKLYKCIKAGYTSNNNYIEVGTVVILTSMEIIEFKKRCKCTFLQGKTSYIVTFDFGDDFNNFNKYNKFEHWYEEFNDVC